MPDSFRQILGVRFHIGSLDELLGLTLQGGLIVVPSAPVLVDMPHNDPLREALQESDFALTDSGFLVLLWHILKKERLPRVSGLRYLRTLLALPEFRAPGATLWVMPSAEDAKANLDWLRRQGLTVADDAGYVAPTYPPGRLNDITLLSRIIAKRPKFVILNLGGGTQERLGYFLRAQLPYRPAIICTGAAIAFLSGRQANIPPWADRMFLGWLLRSLNDPRRFIPRYWRSLKLWPLLRRAG